VTSSAALSRSLECPRGASRIETGCSALRYLLTASADPGEQTNMNPFPARACFRRRELAAALGACALSASGAPLVAQLAKAHNEGRP
jgi:hypothetical protein